MRNRTHPSFGFGDRNAWRLPLRMLGIAMLCTPVVLSACAEEDGILPMSASADQMVTVTTEPATNAHCVLENEKGAWATYTSPESVNVLKAKGPLHVSCESSTGYTGKTVIGSADDVTVLFRNITAVPMDNEITPAQSSAGVYRTDPMSPTYDGSTWKYPTTIVVPVTRDASQDTHPAAVSQWEPDPVPAHRPTTMHPVTRKPVAHPVVHHTCDCTYKPGETSK